MNDALALRNEVSLEAAQALLEATRAAQHPNCLFCRRQNELGLELEFRAIAPGSVRAELKCPSMLQSYPQTLHGGITSALIDAAMTNCLFSLGVVAVTAELTIRYVSPVKLDCGLEVYAKVESNEPPLYFLSAEMKQNGYVVTRGKAKFFSIE